MKVRTLTLAACAAATALLLPALQTGAAAEPSGSGKKSSSCAVTVVSGTGSAGGAVIESAKLGDSSPEHPLTAGYYVEKTEYPNSSTFEATIGYTPPATGGCGSISLLTSPVVVINDENVVLPVVQSRTVHLAGSATSVSIDSLVVGLPANNKSDAKGLCVASQLEVRDAGGAVTAVHPPSGPLVFCPGGGTGKTYI